MTPWALWSIMEEGTPTHSTHTRNIPITHHMCPHTLSNTLSTPKSRSTLGTLNTRSTLNILSIAIPIHTRTVTLTWS